MGPTGSLTSSNTWVSTDYLCIAIDAESLCFWTQEFMFVLRMSSRNFLKCGRLTCAKSNNHEAILRSDYLSSSYCHPYCWTQRDRQTYIFCPLKHNRIYRTQNLIKGQLSLRPIDFLFKKRQIIQMPGPFPPTKLLRRVYSNHPNIFCLAEANQLYNWWNQ